MSFKLDYDGMTCVAKCPDDKYEDDNAEHKCVKKCQKWWYKPNSDGLCKEEVWRKNTAIAVPAALVGIVILAASGFGFFILITRGCYRVKRSNSEPLREKTISDA